jgi:hypothetical protein
MLRPLSKHSEFLFSDRIGLSENSANSFPRARRAEIRLLLDCSRAHLQPGVADRIRHAVKYDLNWDYLINVASRHGALPLLCYNLNRVCANAVPGKTLQELQSRFRANSARNLFLAAELFRLLQFLKGNGVDAVAFKGPVLAVAAYGNLALRQFGDLDVLVKEEDFPKVKELFLTHGYRPWRDLTPLEETQHFRLNHAYTLVRTEDDLRVDLHWRITQERYAFGLDIESLWNRMSRTSFCGRDIFSLSPEDLLIVLCMHGSKHCWERLAWVCDVAELMRANPGLRWDEIMSRSAALRITRAVLLGLDLANRLLDAPLPEHISSVIQNDRGVRWISALTRKRLFVRSDSIGPIESAVLFFLTRERLQNQFPHLAHSFRRAFTPNEHDTTLVSLPQFIRILYYPLRIMRLTTARARGFMSRLLIRARKAPTQD